MKKLIMMLALVSGCNIPAFAVTFTDIKSDVWTNTHFTALDGISGAYYYSAVEGSDNSSQGGVNDKVFTYKGILTANAGWKNALSGNQVGDVVGGPGLNVDTLLGTIFPTFSDIIKSIPSTKFQALLNAGFINLYGGWKTSNGAFDWGYVTGVSLKFGN